MRLPAIATFVLSLSVMMQACNKPPLYTRGAGTEKPDSTPLPSENSDPDREASPNPKDDSNPAPSIDNGDQASPEKTVVTGMEKPAGTGAEKPRVVSKPMPAGNTSPKPGTDASLDLSLAAVKALDEMLARNPASLSELGKQAFARVLLTADDAAKIKIKLWNEFRTRALVDRQEEIKASVVKAAGQTMRYKTKIFGGKPTKGRSLYISLHGGGQATAAVNDEQWDNQISLYQPSEGLYLAPRAPTDTWDLWQLPHIDALLDRLIANYVLTGEVDPDRVYLMGYSAGGDGLYQLGPRMADRLAAGSMSAGHPGDASPIGLRNIGFAIHCGGNDSAYDRNKLAGEWGKTLDAMAKAEPGSYKHQVNVVPGKPHWMDLVDAESVPWMGGFTRNPFPTKVAWHQDDVNHNRFYWIFVDTPKTGSEMTAEIKGQTIILTDTMPGTARIRLNDDMIDLSKDIQVARNGKNAMVKPQRTIDTILKTILEREDPRSVYSAELVIP